MKDYLVRGMSMDGFVKAVAIRSTELVSPTLCSANDWKKPVPLP